MTTVILILKMILMAVIPTATSVLTYVIKNFIDSKVKQSETKEALNKCLSIVESSVKYVQQTYVDTLKKEGSFDEAAQAAALDQAKQKVSELLTDNLITTLQENYGDINSYIETAIESAIKDNKWQN